MGSTVSYPIEGLGAKPPKILVKMLSKCKTMVHSLTLFGVVCKGVITLPHPDVFWYRLSGMGAKKVLVTLLYLFHIKIKWNIVCKYLKAKIFSRDSNIVLQSHWTWNIFGHSFTTIRSLGVSLTYPILKFKKTVCPKKVWMWHCVTLTTFTDSLKSIL